MMEEKGKVVNIETDEEEEALLDLIIEEDEDKRMEEETEEPMVGVYGWRSPSLSHSI